ncbi:response regulator transcription factor [Olivibacter sp. SDN3]|uniref:LytR/AlgR family response regulator transcription factor n=1 Tax=Olivibacter sp. SDN3 TaxID=2764720 RepID=UPI0016510CF8|nr:LytTR family DNA-binding domain-containing protein [Olivibacter sp. SDN3]QNL50973.1 response regulator transcription factor [Olivibacter sp. SDN3]
MMRCLIIDDEQLIRDLLEDNIRQLPFLQLVKSCKNALEAWDIIQKEPIDLLFLDVQMPRMSGLQFLSSLVNPPMVILVTAYREYALEGFNLQVIDYLLKPFSMDRFMKACSRANELFQLKQQQTSSATGYPDFFVHVEYTLVKITIADINYIEGLKDYIKIYLTSQDRPILTRMPMKTIKRKLPPNDFIRTHKSFLVAVKKITTVKRDAVCIGEKEIPVSPLYKENVTRLIHPSS